MCVYIYFGITETKQRELELLQGWDSQGESGTKVSFSP